jgi:hypothetical protein
MPARALALLIGLFACSLSVKPAAALPDGFEDRLVAAVSFPTALAITPDGRMLVTSNSGQLYVYDDGQKTQALNIGFNVCSNSDYSDGARQPWQGISLRYHRGIPWQHAARAGNRISGRRHNLPG